MGQLGCCVLEIVCPKGLVPKNSSLGIESTPYFNKVKTPKTLI
jgi:hypothetical protein